MNEDVPQRVKTQQTLEAMLSDFKRDMPGKLREKGCYDIRMEELREQVKILYKQRIEGLEAKGSISMSYKF